MKYLIVFSTLFISQLPLQLFAADTCTINEGRDAIGLYWDLSLEGSMHRFRHIPAGNFSMGSPATEKGRYDDEEQREIRISNSFAIGQYEVKQKEWLAIMGTLPEQVFPIRPDHPVYFISWNDCQSFIKRSNARLSGFQLRLPSEAEWEYACRAGSSQAINSGENIVETRIVDPALDLLAWFDDQSGQSTHPCGQKSANAWGLYDMHGNIGEWVSDWYGEYMPTDTVDPQGPSSGDTKVWRGGNCFANAEDCRSAFRYWGTADWKNRGVGLRLVLVKQETP